MTNVVMNRLKDVLQSIVMSNSVDQVGNSSVDRMNSLITEL